jgi:hypothetical protein
VHWQKLIRASELYREPVKGQNPNRFYDLHMARRKPSQWDLDEGPSDDEVALLIKFLNDWGTRYPSDEHSQASLKKAYVKVLPRLRLLQGYDLVEARFDSRVADGKTLSETIQEVFEALASAGEKRQWTGTSKILHVLRPHLFVMWDSAIRGGYAVREGSDYSSWFLPLMQRQAREVIDSYVAETKSERLIAVKELEKLGGDKPGEPRRITKLLDEYNYCKFRVRCPELWG